MKPKEFTKHQLRGIEKARASALAQAHDEFVKMNVPRHHQLLMLLLPFTRKLFDYTLDCERDNDMKLTLLRGKKVIARNFDVDQ